MSALRDRWQPDWLSFAALATLAVAFFLSARFPPDYSPEREAVPPAAGSGPGAPHVQDFAFVFNYGRRAVGRPGVSPYSVGEHQRFIRAWLGPRVGSALCFAYSPTLILLFAPLFMLSTPWAWLAWNLGSAWLAAWAVRRAAGTDRALLGVGRAGLISPNTLYGLALGQTALFTTGVLAALLLCARSGRTGRAAAWCAVCAFVLTMKPPLAVVAGAALLAAGYWWSLAGAIAGAVAVLAAAVGWWGPDVVGDYLTLLGRYNLVEVAPVFRAGLVPGLMSNLRNVLLHLGPLDDAGASGISWLAFVAALSAPAFLAAAARRRLSLDLGLAWAAMGYALFSPHLSSTEDLILLVVLLALWRAPGLPARLRLPGAVLCVLPQFVGGSAAVVFGAGLEGAVADALPLIAFAIKLALWAVVAAGVVATHREPVTA
jgi:hypothetical protein